MIVQLKEYKTNPYPFQLIQNLTTNSLLIYMFYTSCDPEIILRVLQMETKTIWRSQPVNLVVNQHKINRQMFAQLKKLWIFLVFFYLQRTRQKLSKLYSLEPTQ